METLLDINAPTEQLVSRQVVAVQQSQGRLRYARITQDGGTICLHHLQDNPLPGRPARVPFQDLSSRLDPTSALTFLDLTWPDSPPRRVYIETDPSRNPSLGSQFVLQCMGATSGGRSYAHTTLEIQREGFEDEILVVGGDFSEEGALGNSVALEVVRSLWSEGLVGGWRYGGDHASAKFYITTRNDGDKFYFSYVFGKVVKGLEVVKDAARASGSHQVTVADCGVVVQLR